MQLQASLVNIKLIFQLWLAIFKNWTCSFTFFSLVLSHLLLLIGLMWIYVEVWMYTVVVYIHNNLIILNSLVTHSRHCCTYEFFYIHRKILQTSLSRESAHLLTADLSGNKKTRAHWKYLWMNDRRNSIKRLKCSIV